MHCEYYCFVFAVPVDCVVGTYVPFPLKTDANNYFVVLGMSLVNCSKDFTMLRFNEFLCIYLLPYYIFYLLVLITKK